MKRSHFIQTRPKNCIICLDPFCKEDKPLECCGEWVHMMDIVKVGRAICPFCRASVEIPTRYKEMFEFHREKFYDYINDPYDDENIILDLREFDLSPKDAKIVISLVMRYMNL